ncbi:CRISPR-associated endonuclease Cas1 [Spirulina subsalsa FACHB-351]|uniref:CRISPR-associated endonuclease Cas1 n=1 Tax=Spirulina subsalsa FACHB-351 TaxID=234711 RepID=A0ABT3L9S8_9CYAN|nr:CRISPR-associated endonuclease Cas1 [Spirulina subsalsa]MCW6038250.1 CRISPR-associated endonuclease Cas1 [Spirulina subsalsa FACHB-351]
MKLSNSLQLMENQTLYLTQPGSFLTTDGRDFAIVQQDQILTRVPIANIQQIVAFTGCDFSKLVVPTAQRYEIPLIFLADHGKMISRLEPPEKAVYLAQQYQSLHQPDFGLQLAQSLLWGRWQNGITLLSHWYRRYTSDVLYRAITQLKESLDTLPTLSHLSAVKVWAQSITPLYRTSWQFLFCQWGAFNLKLDEGYSLAAALLSQELYALLRQAGCSPHVGTLHPDCQNHLPLPCDLMEQFRPLLDQWVGQNSRLLHPHCSLTAWEEFLQTPYTHPYGGVMTLRDCFAWQVREYVTALTEGTAYRPFLLVQ